MSLPDGTQLGSYEILSPLGAGGMGEVYLARDTRLDRQVAVKVLPESMIRDVERVARFEREAKLLAALNHPNIAAIYGFEDHRLETGATRFLVMEYIEGETLSGMLDDGPLAVEDALDIARQMAEALEAAHEKGVIHRDLKPGNVMIRPDGTVKVLDFGLAKAMTGDSSGVDTASSPTITANYTRPGVVLGTAAYMSPEQARGRKVDKRTDIWSFGAILYECLTGAVLFQGETATDSLGAIMHKEPEWALLPAGTPPTVHLLLRRCLAKDRKRRLHDIADARVELEAAIVDPTASSLGLARAAISAEDARGARKLSARLFPILTAALAIALALTLFELSRAKQRVPSVPIHLNVEVSPNVPLSDLVGAETILSPDGTRLVCVAGPRENPQLYSRRLDQQELVPLSGTSDASQPFFSPDGEWIGFFAERKLKRVSVSGGTPISLCETPGTGGQRGASWGDDGNIYFTPSTTTGIWRVAEAGGTPKPVTERADDERSHRWPHVLPGSRGVLLTVQKKGTDFNQASIELLDLRTNERRVLCRGGSYASYLPSGHLVFAREGTIYAVPFDLEALVVLGTPAPVLEGVATDLRNGGARFAFSQNGVLLYRTGGQIMEDTSIVWVDRGGQTMPLLEKLGNYNGPRLSPDGARIALNVFEPSSSSSNVWVYDISRATLSRLTFSEDFDFNPVWSPDGMRAFFSSTRESSIPNLFVKPSDGTGVAERLTSDEEPQIVTDVSPDGGTIVFHRDNDDTEEDIMTLEFAEGSMPEVFLQTPFSESWADLSPDGRWIAYHSDESGQTEVYVRPFGHGGGKWQISTAGGRAPLWSPDGKELFYRAGNALMVVPMEIAESSLRAGNPSKLFELEWGGMGFARAYDVTPDGERFIALKRETPVGAIDRTHIRLIINWFDEVESRVPAVRD